MLCVNTSLGISLWIQFSLGLALQTFSSFPNTHIPAPRAGGEYGVAANQNSHAYCGQVDQCACNYHKSAVGKLAISYPVIKEMQLLSFLKIGENRFLGTVESQENT